MLYSRPLERSEPILATSQTAKGLAVPTHTEFGER